VPSHGVPGSRLSTPPRLASPEERFFNRKERKEHKEKNRIFPVKDTISPLKPFFSAFFRG
jgi:hypothetical protein